MLLWMSEHWRIFLFTELPTGQFKILTNRSFHSAYGWLCCTLKSYLNPFPSTSSNLQWQSVICSLRGCLSPIRIWWDHKFSLLRASCCWTALHRSPSLCQLSFLALLFVQRCDATRLLFAFAHQQFPVVLLHFMHIRKIVTFCISCRLRVCFYWSLDAFCGFSFSEGSIAALCHTANSLYYAACISDINKRLWWQPSPTGWRSGEMEDLHTSVAASWKESYSGQTAPSHLVRRNAGVCSDNGPAAMCDGVGQQLQQAVKK